MKRISRIDHDRTHGYFVRVYRDTWVGNRSFSDGVYGGEARALAAAEKWSSIVEAELPPIPERPVHRKASFRSRSDGARSGLRYYDVYLPEVEGKGFETHKLYFKNLDEQKRMRERAKDMVDARNDELTTAFTRAMVEWTPERERLLSEIRQAFPELKAMPLEVA